MRRLDRPVPVSTTGTDTGFRSQPVSEPSRRALLIAGGAAAGLLMLRPGPALALTLDQARSQGLVGERPDGYVGVVSNAAGVSDLVNRVNAERRAAYQDIARRTGAPMAAVEQRAGAQLIDRASPGWFVMTTGGQWQRK